MVQLKYNVRIFSVFVDKMPKTGDLFAICGQLEAWGTCPLCPSVCVCVFYRNNSNSLVNKFHEVFWVDR